MGLTNCCIAAKSQIMGRRYCFDSLVGRQIAYRPLGKIAGDVAFIKAASRVVSEKGFQIS
jgi:hypothetical protein